MRGGRASSTAQDIALARSWLTRHGVIDDPFARHFVGRSRQWVQRACDIPLVKRLAMPGFTYVAARTRFYDALVDASLDAGISQVVIVAAGFDCRAWRLARPDVRFFEVDHPDTQAVKRERMAGADGAGPTYVPADLAVTSLDGVLYPAGFNPAVPTVFCCEGLTMYLTKPAVADLLACTARLAAPGSRLGVDFARGQSENQPDPGLVVKITRGSARLRGERMQFLPLAEDAEDLLVRGGWAIDEMLTSQEVADRYLADAGLDPSAAWRGSFVVAATVRH